MPLGLGLDDAEGLAARFEEIYGLAGDHGEVPDSHTETGRDVKLSAVPH
jgi:hypothetical protein